MATSEEQNTQADLERTHEAEQQNELAMAPPVQCTSDKKTVKSVQKNQELFSAMYSKDCSVVHDLGLILDKKQAPVSKDVISLADILEAPEIIKDKCRSNYNHSPSSDLINLPEVSRSTIEDFIAKLKKIEREDLVNLINKIPKDKKVEILMLNKNHKLFDDITSKLDQSGHFNWKLLAQEYNIDCIQLLEMGTNPSQNFLQDYAYISVKREDLTLSSLKRHMSDLGREEEITDLFEEIKESDLSKSMTDVFAPYSDNMEKLCKVLNKNNGWMRLAGKWKLEKTRYFWFIPEKYSSATEILLDWLMIQKPEFTVDQLDKSLQKIGREDARAILDKKFNEYVDKSLL